MKYMPLLFALLFAGCMSYGPPEKENVPEAGRRGLFIVNEGNYTYTNASLSYYNIETRKVENDVFLKKNGFKLGDVAQSMTIYGGTGYVVVNNSSVVFAIDPDTFESKNKITGLVSPRYVYFVSDSKAYVTDLHSPKISVFDPRTQKLTGSIPTDFGGRRQPSTEQMIGFGRYVFTNCWSYDNRMLVIDTDTDTVVESIGTGKQPNSMVLDAAGKIWVLSDGGLADAPEGREEPSLHRIDAAARTIEKTFVFGTGERAADICIDGAGEVVYVLKDHVWKMGIGDDAFPQEPFIRNTTGNYWYAIAVDPETSEIYLADAVDREQPGVVYRFSPQGELVDKFTVGVIPGTFCFYSRSDE